MFGFCFRFRFRAASASPDDEPEPLVWPEGAALGTVADRPSASASLDSPAGAAVVVDDATALLPSSSSTPARRRREIQRRGVRAGARRRRRRRPSSGRRARARATATSRGRVASPKYTSRPLCITKVSPLGLLYARVTSLASADGAAPSAASWVSSAPSRRRCPGASVAAPDTVGSEADVTPAPSYDPIGGDRRLCARPSPSRPPAARSRGCSSRAEIRWRPSRHSRPGRRRRRHAARLRGPRASSSAVPRSPARRRSPVSAAAHTRHAHVADGHERGAAKPQPAAAEQRHGDRRHDRRDAQPPPGPDERGNRPAGTAPRRRQRSGQAGQRVIEPAGAARRRRATGSRPARGRGPAAACVRADEAADSEAAGERAIHRPVSSTSAREPLLLRASSCGARSASTRGP